MALTPSEPEASLYLDLLKRCLVGAIPSPPYQLISPPRGRLKRMIYDLLRRRGLELAAPVSEETYRHGLGYPAGALTMLGLERLDNVQHCIEDVLARDVPGDFIEAGVWRGGATILMRGILKAHQVTDRRVWAADSFAGLPPPDEERFPADRGDTLHADSSLAVDLDAVRFNFERFGLLDSQVRFVKGRFRDTLPALHTEQWAVIRLDGDMYESTMDGLVNLYPGLALGGYAIIDDYRTLEPCRTAVDEFRGARGIDEQIRFTDWNGAYWRRDR